MFSTYGVLAGYNINSNHEILIENIGSIEVIDQQQTTSGGLGCPFFGYLWLGQGFIPSLNTLTKIEVKLFKGGDPTSPIIISIRDSLSGTDLTSASIDGNLVTQYGEWFEFNFPDLGVIPGNSYYIICRSSGGSISNYYCVEFNINNPYPKGEAWGSINYGNNWALIEDYYPDYPESDACFKIYGLDESPIAPIINGNIQGNAGIEYTYALSSNDPEGHNLSYYVEWDDGTTSEWTSEYASGETITLTHIWQNQGTYTIKAKAKDIYGAESNWGELDVTMPKNKMMIRNSWFYQLLERFPIIQNRLLCFLRIRI
jgi:hypothetical protein